MSISLVSFIVTSYNKGKFLHETIDSILSQTYTNWELLIIDDNSKDQKTLESLAELEGRGYRVIRMPENRGVAAARNLGIIESKGDVILFLDGDDMISKNYTAEAVDLFNSNLSIDVITSEVNLFGTAKGPMRLLDVTIENTVAQNTLVISSFFRRSALKGGIQFDDTFRKGFEDWDFWLSLLGSGAVFFRIKKPHFFYRIHPGSRNFMESATMDKIRISLMKKHRNLFLQHPIMPKMSFEYHHVIDSPEYRIGSFIWNKLMIKSLFHLLKHFR